jgi:sugar phosphate isomerase/epimerase
MCRTTGLLPSAIYGMGFGSDDNRELTMDVCHKLRMVDAAREIGCARIVATGAKRGTKGGLDAIIAALREIVPYAEQRGVLISLENHADNSLETIEDYDRIFSAVDSPNLGLCVDTGHFDASGVDLDAVIDHFGLKINHVHIKEAAAVGEARFVPFGEGVTDNNHVIERMIEQGYHGFVSLEYVALDMSHPLEHMKVPWEMFGRYAEV